MTEARRCKRHPGETIEDGLPCEICEAQIVHCDEDCGALTDPRTPEEIAAAYLHWRNHPYLSGCSHAR